MNHPFALLRVLKKIHNQLPFNDIHMPRYLLVFLRSFALIFKVFKRH